VSARKKWGMLCCLAPSGSVGLIGASVAYCQEMPEQASQGSGAHEHHDSDHSNGSHEDHDSAQNPEPAAPTPAFHDDPSITHKPSDNAASESQHVPPDPPQHLMESMPYREMARSMQMDDTERVGKVLLDQFEWRTTSTGAAARWEAQAWYGGDDNKLWVKMEGQRVQSTTQDARVDLLWDRIISRWWDVQAGARHDFGAGPSRTWAAFGVEGLAPYWFDVEATFYVGEESRTSARLRAEYDLLLTQRLILQPEAEANLYGKSDAARQIGSGLSDLEVGLRLRYEIRREIAPYVGLVWSRRFAGTADLARAAGEDPSDVQVVAGVRVWF
jgi:copper resistance protein B